jgi:hypothetical protein
MEFIEATALTIVVFFLGVKIFDMIQDLVAERL